MSLFNQDVLEKFIQFDVDEESQEFLESCNDKTNYVFTQMAHTVIKNVLRFFISVTTING